MSNRIILITAPSGTGKTTIMNSLRKTMGINSILGECISHTTRAMRKGEVDGQTYYFIGEEEFGDMNINDEFAELVLYSGNRYGLSKAEINRSLEKYSYVYMIVEYEGYKQIKELYPESIGIFLHMSKEDCMANMLLRGDSISMAANRIDKYDAEMKNRNEYDYVIKNIRGNIKAMLRILENVIYQNS